jgi:divalent metal cation (Fe/Co/Zn/Cd) transporter
MKTWSKTILENVNSLVGKSASPDYLQKLTYICWNHHQAIQHIDTVKAYTFGSHYFVEVDVVLPSNMPLQQAHDVGESLQEKLESLPDIERAFVHIDYEYTHRP